MIKYIKKYRKTLLLAVILTSISSFFAVRVQFLKGNVLDFALAKDSQNTLNYGVLLGAFILIEIGIAYLYELQRSAFTMDTMKSLRRDYFRKLLEKHYQSFLKKSQGSYIAQYMNQMEMVQRMYFATIPLLLEVVFKIILVSISLFILDYRIAIVTLVLLTTPLYVPKLAEKKLQTLQEEDVRCFEYHVTKITNWLSNFEVIKNYSIEDKIQDKFDFSNEEVRNKGYAMRRMSAITMSLSAILSYISHFIVLILAAYFVYKGYFSAGKFFIAVGMIDQLSYPIISISTFIHDFIAIQPVCKELEAFLNVCGENEKLVHINRKEITDIVYDSVTFGYSEDKPLFKDLNLIFKKNGKYLIQGENGSGKTTAINLMTGYYKPILGKVIFANHEVDDIENLNDFITVMRQEALFFEDTLRNNITMYNPYTDNQVNEVLNMVGLHKYANEQSLNSIIQEGGINFSGGEKRRIALARSILRETPILVLDEPLANLDVENVNLIEELIFQLKDKTIILISHQFNEDKLEKFDAVYKL